MTESHEQQLRAELNDRNVTILPTMLRQGDQSFIDEPMNTYWGEVKRVETLGLWYSVEGGPAFFIRFGSEDERHLMGLDWAPDVLARATSKDHLEVRCGKDGTVQR